MSQCVPSLELDEHPSPARLPGHPHTNSNFTFPDVSPFDHEVAELTWENGQLALHCLGHPRLQFKPPPNSSPISKYGWDKPRASGTLESIVNQATCSPHLKQPSFPAAAAISDEIVPWIDQHHAQASATATMTMDALVPYSNRTEERSSQVLDTCVVGCSTRVGSCSGAVTHAGVARVRASVDGDSRAEQSRDHSVSGSATCGRGNRHVKQDSHENKLGVPGFTSTSMGSPVNTSSGNPFSKATTTDDHDSVCHSTPQREASGGQGKSRMKGSGKSSVSTKKSRAAAVHNQSERKRRDKINQRMKTLQKLVPSSSKTDKASILDEVIEYLKQLQAQIQMMSRVNMPSMMLPMAIQQQLQLSMMAQMGLGMGMGMGMRVMDMNTIGHNGIPGIQPVIPPTAFMPLNSWENSAERLPTPYIGVPETLSTFMASQSQPMDTYNKLVSLYQQLNQSPLPNSES